MSEDAVSVALIVYCFIAVWFVGGLTVFHIYLISTNQVTYTSSVLRISENFKNELITYVLFLAQTTYENFRYRYDKKENPFNRSFFKNVRELFFAKIPPSLVNFRAWATDDDFSFRSGVSDFTGGFMASKNNFDIETGKTKQNGVPTILKDLDYTDIDDGVSKKKADGAPYDPFYKPNTTQPPVSKDSSTDYRQK